MLDYPGDDPELINIGNRGFVDLRIALGRENEFLVGSFEGPLEGHHRGSPTDHEWGHHVRKYDHVPQRNDRKRLGFTDCCHLCFFRLEGHAGWRI